MTYEYDEKHARAHACTVMATLANCPDGNAAVGALAAHIAHTIYFEHTTKDVEAMLDSAIQLALEIVAEANRRSASPQTVNARGGVA